MPGVVTMDSGGHGSFHTDHDINTKANGTNGTPHDASHGTPSKETAPPAPGDSPDTTQSLQLKERSAPYPSRMNNLPDEIEHITDGFISLSNLLPRLAQVTHNALQDTIAGMAKMPLPTAFTNGNSSHSPASDDISAENLRKKDALLSFAQDHHAKWVKALVITEWSRKVDKVSKLIDLQAHIVRQRMLYDAAVGDMANIKRDLIFARMPSPDLKTALHILSTGSAPWMPDLQYIDPPPLTAEEQLKWMNDLNTLLSLRLNLEEFDKIPAQFRDYEIGSGRVKFKVPGEFEVDLTIADEDFEKQFWFIDFRFDFKPSTSSLSESLRGYLEACVNDALSKDGLTGCYQFLHEYVLTCKINELRRQAVQMSRKSWTGTLTVEPLHRALAIQYWTSRTPPQGPKSWVLVAVHSGRNQKAPKDDSKPTSHLVARWYRDNKEVEQCNVSLDDKDLSAQNLLRGVIGKHVEFILRGIHDKMSGASRFRNREAGMVLNISESDPTLSALTVQVGHQLTASLLIEPTTGSFVLKPHSKFTIQSEQQLNNGRNQIEDGAQSLETVRCNFIEDEINRTGSRAGWLAHRPQLTSEEVRSVTRKREWSRVLWLRQSGWGEQWLVAVVLNLDGDEWWLVDTSLRGANFSQHFQTKLPLNKGHPDLTDHFWYRLTFLASGMIAQAVDLRELYQRQIKHILHETYVSTVSSSVRMPAITFKLSALLPEMVFQPKGRPSALGQDLTNLGARNVQAGMPDERITTAMSLSSKQPWANDFVALDFQGVQTPTHTSTDGNDALSHALLCVSTATISVRNSSKIKGLSGKVDRDVSYDPAHGRFRLRMRHAVGVSILPLLKSRLQAIDRFVSFLQAFDDAHGTMTSHSATLNEVSCFYSDAAPTETEGNADSATAERWKVVMDLSGNEIQVRLEKDNPHLRVIDLITRLVNFDGGIRSLMIWLPSSLPALRAISEIESRWEEIQDRAQGNVEFSIRQLDWMGIRYSIHTTDELGLKETKQLQLDCRLRLHKEEPWWHLCRSDEVGTDDSFNTALQTIWNNKGEDWLGLSTGAAGKLSGGVGKMLDAVDEAVRAMVGTIGGEQDALLIP